MSGNGLTRAIVFFAWSLILIGSSARSFAQISFIQQNFGSPDDDTASSISVQFPLGQHAGNLNVVAVGWCDDSSNVASISDTKGNSYVLGVGPTISGGSSSQSIYYAADIAAANASANTVTVTFDSDACFPDVRIAEYAGIDNDNPVDAVAGAVGTGTAMNSGSLTTTHPYDLLVATDYVELSTGNPGSGYTLRLRSDADNILEDQVVTTAGTYSATATQVDFEGTATWIMQLIAFRGATAGVPPAAPTNLSASAVSTSAISLTWTASTSSPVSSYLIERCQGSGCSSFTQIGSVPGTSYSDTGLSASTSYRYRIRAIDASNVYSTYSNTASATTHTPDIEPPSAPAGLAASTASGSAISLSWQPSTDNVAVTGYFIEAQQCSATCGDFVQVSSSPTTPRSVVGLASSTTYRFRVRATDSAGNLSDYSNVATAATAVAGSAICD